MKSILFFLFTLSITVMSLRGNALAQGLRSHVNKGVDLYNKGKYVQSEIQFKKGLDKSPKNFQANFNLGDSYYKEGDYSGALKYFQSALSKTKSSELRSKVYHNIGNSLLKDKKIKESIAAYTDALKLNPGDMSTKYNLSYALDMLKHNKNNKNDKNKQKNKDQNKKNKDNQDKNQNKNNRNQNKNQQNNQQQNQEQEKLSKEQAQAIFAALNHDEQKLQKKLRKFKGKPTKITKDW